MKVCNTEAMKLIKEYEARKQNLLITEAETCTTSYKEGEKKITNGYDYEGIRAQIREIDERVRHIRAALAKANCTVLVDKFNVTIGEALVMLAQAQNEKNQIAELAGRRQLTRRITANGVLEYTECLYDVEKANADVEAVRNRINALQLAVDRANLTNFIEI